jgi:hypothetical protein
MALRAVWHFALFGTSRCLALGVVWHCAVRALRRSGIAPFSASRPLPYYSSAIMCLTQATPSRCGA